MEELHCSYTVQTQDKSPIRWPGLAVVEHVAVLLLILVRVGRIMHKTNEHMAWITCTKGSPTETDLITKCYFFHSDLL